MRSPLLRLSNELVFAESGAALAQGEGIWYHSPNNGRSMLRGGMRTLNGKARQTAVAAFVRMPEPPPLEDRKTRVEAR